MFHDHRDNDPYACNVPYSCACEAPGWNATLRFSEFTGSKIPRVLLIVLEELVIVVLVVVVVVVLVEVVVVVVALVIIVVVVELVVVVIVLALVILVVEDRISPFCDRHGEQIDAKTASCATDFKGASESALPQFVHCLAAL